MHSRPLRIFVHDYAGHPPQVHVSRELARQGHTVLHAYASMIQTPRAQLSRKADDAAGFAIVGVDIGERFAKHSYFKRQWQEIKYGRALVKCAAAFAPDLVVCSNTPLFPLNALRRFSKRRGVAFIFWMMDVYGFAVRDGMARKIPLIGGLTGGAYIAFEKFLVKRADRTIVISEDFRDLLVKWRVPAEKVDTLPLWAPIGDIPVRPKDNPWSRSQGLTETINLLYSGTLGLKHNPQHLATLAMSLRDRPEVRVIVISSGLGAEFLTREKAARQLENLRILPFQSFADMPDILGASDVLLALLEPSAGVFSVPGKVLTHLCAGRPQVGMIPFNNRAVRVIRESRSGVVVDPNDPNGFVEAVTSLVDNPERRAELGRLARAYAEKEFDIVRIGAIFEAMILQPVRKRADRSP
jgi:colanic acid biosynthesis glycosyl transferase WcaI